MFQTTNHLFHHKISRVSELWTTGHFLRPLIAALSPPPGPPNQLITEAEGADGARPGLPLPHGTARGELTWMVGSGENEHAGDII